MLLTKRQVHFLHPGSTGVFCLRKIELGQLSNQCILQKPLAICVVGYAGFRCRSMGFLPDNAISRTEVMSLNGLAKLADVHFLAVRKAHLLPNDKANEIGTEDRKK
jgi:hypothetical protein